MMQQGSALLVCYVFTRLPLVIYYYVTLLKKKTTNREFYINWLRSWIFATEIKVVYKSIKQLQ